VTQVVPRNYVLRGVEIPPREWAILRVVRPIEKHCKAYDFAGLCKRVSPVETAELIKMSFRELTHVGPRNHVLDGGQDQVNPFSAARGVKSAM